MISEHHGHVMTTLVLRHGSSVGLDRWHLARTYHRAPVAKVPLVSGALTRLRTRRPFRVVRIILGALLVVGAASRSAAAEPEELEQLEPGAGAVQLEYQGLFGPTAGNAGRPHSLGFSYGVSDRLALGAELAGTRNGGDLDIDEIELSAQYRFALASPDTPGLGLKLSAALDTGGDLSEVEARLIAEQVGPRWWLQANAIVAHEREDGAPATSIAYGANASRSVAPDTWVGIEASGAVARIAGRGEFSRGHFLGPSATVEVEFDDGPELEFGLVYSRRVAGDGPTDSLRVFAQLEF